jgi:hypothetical protein
VGINEKLTVESSTPVIIDESAFHVPIIRLEVLVLPQEEKIARLISATIMKGTIFIFLVLLTCTYVICKRLG